MVETSASGAKGEFPISIRTASYPVTISWTLNPSEHASYAIASGSKNTQMASTGAVTITDPATKSVVIRTTSGALPAQFALSQNYPNPFNPTTRFRIDVATGSPVDVTVFDILGRKIATILHAEKEAGSYTMEWNGRDDQGLAVPTGMYIIRMSAGEFTASQKVSLLK
jgi:flagellar hook assembly protein FlgD